MSSCWVFVIDVGCQPSRRLVPGRLIDKMENRLSTYGKDIHVHGMVEFYIFPLSKFDSAMFLWICLEWGAWFLDVLKYEASFSCHIQLFQLSWNINKFVNIRMSKSTMQATKLAWLKKHWSCSFQWIYGWPLSQYRWILDYWPDKQAFSGFSGKLQVVPYLQLIATLEHWPRQCGDEMKTTSSLLKRRVLHAVITVIVNAKMRYCCSCRVWFYLSSSCTTISRLLYFTTSAATRSISVDHYTIK